MLVGVRKGIVLLLAGLLLLSACGDGGKSKSKKRHLVETAAVTHNAIETQLTQTGTLEAIHLVKLHNQEPGRILTLPVYPGDEVKKGDILVRLDDTLIRPELDKAVAARKQAQLNLTRLNRLMPQQLASQHDLAQARTVLEQARAQEALLRARLSRTVIKAPFDGIISQRHFEPGDIVPLHSHILSIYQSSPLRALIQISELLLENIQPGTKVGIRIDALGNQRYPAHVERIYPTIDLTTRQGTLEIALTNVPAGARPGQLCRVTLKAHTIPLLSVPFNAIRYDIEGEYVFRVINGTAVRSPVKTGVHINDRIQILSGIEAGDLVVVKGFLSLRNGKPVEVVHHHTPESGQPDSAAPSNPEPVQPDQRTGPAR